MFLRDVASVSELSLVVNYMTGFPWEDPDEAQAKYHEVIELVKSNLGNRGCVEHNTFELERRAPMAKFPELYDICKDSISSWPWASVMNYKKYTKHK